MSETESKYQIVQTVKSTYVCERAEEKNGKLVMTNTIEIPQFDITNAVETAKKYVKAKILGIMRNISVSQANVEGQEEAQTELQDLITSYNAHIPGAEKKARNKAILKEVMISIGEQDDDNDD